MSTHAARARIDLATAAAPPPRDVETGPCRRDADCPTGQRCTEASRAHMQDRNGKIVADEIVYECAAAPE